MSTAEEIIQKMLLIQSETSNSDDGSELYLYKERIDNIILGIVVGMGISDETKKMMEFGTTIKKDIVAKLEKLEAERPEIKCFFQNPPIPKKDTNITAYDRVLKEFDLIEQIFKAQKYKVGDTKPFPFVLEDQVPGLIPGRYFLTNFIMSDTVFMDIHSFKDEYTSRVERASNFEVLSAEKQHILERASELKKYYSNSLTDNNQDIVNLFQSFSEIPDTFKAQNQNIMIPYSAVTAIREYQLYSIYLERNKFDANLLGDIAVYTSFTMVTKNKELIEFCNNVILFLHNLPIPEIPKPTGLNSKVTDPEILKAIFNKLKALKFIGSETSLVNFLFIFQASEYPINWKPVRWIGSRKDCFSFMHDMIDNSIQAATINQFFTQDGKNPKTKSQNRKPLNPSDRTNARSFFLDWLLKKKM